jgi:ABC-type glutathione transport system ATPase component
MTADTKGAADGTVLPETDPPVIETREVSRFFSAGRDALGRSRPSVKAVDGVSLAIRRGETLALVGETGSGKTTFGRLLLSLYRPTSGDILYRGKSILDRHSKAAQSVRRQVQGVFQDPYSSLNPTMTVGSAQPGQPAAPTPSAAASASASASPGPSPSSPRSSSPTSRCPPSTCPSRPRCST